MDSAKHSFYVLSEAGDGLGIALQLQDEGHEVCMDITDGRTANRGKGLVTKQHDWDFESNGNTIVLFDCTGDGITADMLRASNPVFGSSHLADRLEMDREYATSVFESCGVRVPKSRHFDDWDAGREFVESQDEVLAFKPGAEHSGVIPSYVPDSKNPVDELLHMMSHFESKLGTQPSYELQEYIHGVAISSEGWFNGQSFMQPFNHTLEQKKTWAGNLGKSGGCAGNVVWVCDNDCPLCEQLFTPALTQFLQENSYGPGLLDINSIVDESGVAYAVEFTPRFGYDATPTLVRELLGGSAGELFHDLAIGASRELPFRSGYAAGIRLSISPWPAEDHPADSGLLIQGLPKLRPFEHFVPMDVMLDPDDNLVTSGGYGIIGVATGHGNSVQAAFDEAYSVAKRIHIPEVQYRLDLTEEFQKSMRKLTKSFGVAVGA